MLWIDIETYSETPIADGTDNYARDAEIMLVAYAIGDAPVRLWDATETPDRPADLSQAIDDQAALITAHNAAFERTVFHYADWGIDPSRYRCTMAQALAHGLPGALEKLCDIFGIAEEQAKLKDSKQLIHLFCKPQPKGRKLRRATRETHPAEWERFKQYCINDVEAMRAVARKMPNWNYSGDELALWQRDQRINHRGILIDLDLVNSALETAQRVKSQLAERAQELTDGEIAATTQRDALLTLLNEGYDLDLPDLRGSTVEKLLKSEADLPPVLRELLENRLAASSTSVSKYKRFKQLTGPDGRLRNTLQFCGAARTGRWAGRGVQLQNLPRPSMKQKAIDSGIEALKADCADLICEKPMELMQSAVRGCIIAPPGKKLVVADLSNIEGRMLAWLAREEWKLKAFADFDTCMGEDGQWHSGDDIRDAALAGRPIALKRDKKGEPIRKGHDLYALAYAKAFNITPEEVMENKKSGDGMMRQVGKVMELACIAEGQLVLTDVGLVPIEHVSATMRVWDGCCFVQHDGVIFRGIKEVVEYDGLTATEDHLVWIEGQEEPIHFGVAAASGARLVKSGAGGTALRVCGDHLAGASLHAGLVWSVCADAMHELRERPMDGLLELDNREVERLPAVLATEVRPGLDLQTPRGGEVALHESERPRVLGIRREGDNVWVPVRAGSSEVGCCESWHPAEGTGTGPRGQRQGVRPWQSAMGFKTAEQVKHASAPASRLEPGRVALHEGSGVPPLACGDDAGRDICGCVERRCGETQELARHTRQVAVFDIMNAGPNNRFTVSDCLVHNCGYEGGAGAFTAFALAYGIDLDYLAAKSLPNMPGRIIAEAEKAYQWAEKNKRVFGLSHDAYVAADGNKRLWREAHPAICTFWKALEQAVRAAILAPGKVFTVRSIKVVKTKAWLRIVLPSGRSLCYPAPKIDEENKISYMGINQYSRKWQRLGTYDGKLAENVTQAASRDVIAFNLPHVEAAGYEVLVTVHDEDITEAPDTPEYNADHLASIMATNPPWGAGLPLAAAGFEAYTYRKD